MRSAPGGESPLDVKDVPLTLEPGQLVVLTSMLSKSSAAEGEAEVKRRQFFGPQVLHEVTPEAPLTQTISIDAETLKGASRAWVRIVAERLGRGEGVVEVNGKEYPLPPAVTPENTARIMTLELPIEAVKASNELVFKTAGAHDAGYLLGMNSLVVESQ